MPNVLYVDACGGASGDMLAGALLDLGWPLDELRALAAAMGLADTRLEAKVVEHNHLRALRLEVDCAEKQPHRHLRHVLEHLDRLPADVAEAAGRVFRRLAEAEARVHGIEAERVHFHEVGAVDAIIDVTAFCAGLAWLGWPRLVCSPLPLGQGFVDCAHGRLPLPAPAVLNLLGGVPVRPWPAEEETVTPTGAALLSTLAHQFGPLPAMRLEAVGVGGGSRQGQCGPNIARLLTGQEDDGVLRDELVEIVCHIDDMQPEDMPLAIARLMSAGALDAAAAPLQMKKGRPGWRFIVLARPEQAEELAALVLEQTTTLGVRLRRMGRMILPRRVIEVQSPWGPARIKVSSTSQGPRLHPEADDVAAIAQRTGLAPAKVRQELTALAAAQL